MEEIKSFSFGAIPSSYDLRDYRISKNAESSISMPDKFKLDVGHVKDQGNMGTCTAHSLATIIEYHYKTETNIYRRMSTSFIYGFRGDVTEDKSFTGEGMKIRDALKVANHFGDVEYSLMPGNYEYDKSEKIVKEEAENLMDVAYENRISSYYKITNESELKYSLMNDGPVIAGMYWFDSCELKDGIYCYDKSQKHDAHAVVIIGWDEDNWIVQNSWGRYWGDGGLFYIPIDKSFGEVIYEAYGITDNIKNIYTPPDNILITIINYIVNIVIKLLKR